MKKIHFIIIFFMHSLLSVSQSIFMNVCEPQSGINAPIAPSNIYLIGEYHYFRGNFNIGITYHKMLMEKNVYPSYVIDEEGPSYGFLMNKYLESGDDKLFDILEENKNLKNAYVQYREFYLSLQSDKKFQHVGIDQERYLYMTHYAIRYIILENIESYYASMKNYPEIDWAWINGIIHSFEEKPYPTLWGKKELKNDIDRFFYILDSKDSTIFKNSILKDYNIISDIKDAYNLMGKRKKFFIENETQDVQSEREIFLTNNAYKILIRQPDAIIIGQMGIFHTVLKEYLKKPKAVDKIRLAYALNNDPRYPLTNQKVSSNIIYYQNTKPKHYSFLQIDFKKILPLFEGMNNCDLLIKGINNDKVSNLILYKNR